MVPALLLAEANGQSGPLVSYTSTRLRDRGRCVGPRWSPAPRLSETSRRQTVSARGMDHGDGRSEAAEPPPGNRLAMAAQLLRLRQLLLPSCSFCESAGLIDVIPCRLQEDGGTDGRPTSPTTPLPRRTRPSISTSMTACDTSSNTDTRCKGEVRTSSPVSVSTGHWPCAAFNASADGRRRGLCGEASRKAGCGKSARPV